MSETPTENLTFEEALAQLDEIVHELEDGKTGLEDALARYEAGVLLLKRCYAQLSQAEQRILLLTGEDAQGKPVTQPFNHAATADVEKTDPKRRRKDQDDADQFFGQ